MVKVLILGSTGMLGHKLYQVLNPMFDVTGTIRGSYRDVSKYGFFQQERIVPNVDACEISQVEKVIEETNPDLVINSIGIVKQLEEKAGVLLNIWLNSLFPHQLYQICQAKGIRLKGHYRRNRRVG